MKRRIVLIIIICLVLVTSLFVFGTGVIAVGTKYYVLATPGNHNWNSTATWSDNLSGSPTGAVVPGASNDCLPSQTIVAGATLACGGSVGQTCKSLDFTGSDNGGTTNITVTMGSSGLVVLGNLTFIANMTLTASGTGFTVGNTSGTSTLKTGGLVITLPITINGVGGTMQLGNAYVASGVSGYLTITNGIFQCAGYALTTPGGIALAAGATFDYSGVTVTNTGTFTANTSATVTSTSSSKLILNGTIVTIALGSHTYNGEVDINASTPTISGSNTFNNNGLVLPSSVTQTIKFTNGTTQHGTNWTLSGSSGHVHTLTNTSGTSTWAIVKDGGGTVWADWVTINYSVATPTPSDSFYYGANSTFNSTSGWTKAVLPSITISAASPVGSTTTTLNGNITNLNGSAVDPTITMYYGQTDGLQVPANWTYNVSPTYAGGVAAFSYNATSLSASTLYYFSAKATNPAGTVWVSGSLNFTTTSGGTNIKSVLGVLYGSINSVMGVPISSAYSVLGVH